MKISGRNLFQGRVGSIRKGAVNAEVVLRLPGGDSIVSVVTAGAADRLGLREGSAAFAVVKASSVLLAKEMGDGRLSARNVLPGRIGSIVEGPVSAEVTVALGGGDSVTSVITEGSVKRLALKAGDEVWAVFKASSVILGVEG